MYTPLFSPIDVGGKRLENRIVMAPLYLGYAGEGGTITPLLLEHCRLMARSSAAMITVENAIISCALTPTLSCNNNFIFCLWAAAL